MALGQISHAIIDCLPAGWEPEQADALKAADFEIVETAEREAFAKEIVYCLDNAVPERREFAFDALSHMLREKQLSDATKRGLLVLLTDWMSARDVMGYRQPYAALALSEVARADRIDPFLTEDELVKLLVEAQHWFINVQDYRGFSDKEGWRHAVAHGSDLLLQLVLNPRIDAEGMRVIVSAVGVQVAPKGHAYIHGESERLARPILFAAGRGVMSEKEWSDWLMALATPVDADPKLADWVFASEAGLAWRHNVMGFLQALYMNVVIGSDPKDDVLRPGLEAALKAMP